MSREALPPFAPNNQHNMSPTAPAGFGDIALLNELGYEQQQQCDEDQSGLAPSQALLSNDLAHQPFIIPKWIISHSLQ
jgi:hypothetical protein